MGRERRLKGLFDRRTDRATTNFKPTLSSFAVQTTPPPSPSCYPQILKAKPQSRGDFRSRIWPGRLYLVSFLLLVLSSKPTPTGLPTLEPTPEPTLEPTSIPTLTPTTSTFDIFLEDSTWTAEWSGYVDILVVAGGGGGGGRSGGGGGGGGVVQAKYYVDEGTDYNITVGAGMKMFPLGSCKPYFHSNDALVRFVFAPNALNRL